MPFEPYEQSYDLYPRIEEEFNAALAVSLDPRGPDCVYDVIASLGLPRGSAVVDVGCGEGQHSIELARRLGFTVQGVDPVARNLEVARERLAADAEGARGCVWFVRGQAERLPLDQQSVDLAYYREMLYHVEDLVAAFTECRRVLKPHGRVVIYHLFSTERLERREAEWFWARLGTFASSADHHHMEEAITSAGLRILENIELASETGEWAEEQHGKASRELLAASRLLRAPQRYIERFGQAAYDIKLADSFWHVYRMIGKLSNRIYVLGRAD